MSPSFHLYKTQFVGGINNSWPIEIMCGSSLSTSPLAHSTVSGSRLKFWAMPNTESPDSTVQLMTPSRGGPEYTASVLGNTVLPLIRIEAPQGGYGTIAGASP